MSVKHHMVSCLFFLFEGQEKKKERKINKNNIHHIFNRLYIYEYVTVSLVFLLHSHFHLLWKIYNNKQKKKENVFVCFNIVELNIHVFGIHIYDEYHYEN
jgi:hypothetical protein